MPAVGGTRMVPGPSPSGTSVQFVRLTPSADQSDGSGPSGQLPVVSGLDLSSLSTPVASPGTNVDVGRGFVDTLNYVGPDVSVAYAEVTVTNQDGTEVLIVGTAAPVVIPAGTQHQFTQAELSVVQQQTGSDLTLASNGKIVSAAGGVFTVALYVRLT